MAERVQTVTSKLSQTPAGEYARAGSVKRLPLKARLAAIALTAPGMAVFLAACGGDSGGDSGKTFTGEQVTQTAQANEPATATTTAQKVVEVPLTPTLAPTKTPEPIPTPTPEKVYTPAEVSSIVTKAVNASTNVDLGQRDFIVTSVQLAEEMYNGADDVRITTVYKSYARAGKALLKIACDNPANADSARAFLAVKAVVNGYMGEKIAAGAISQSTRDSVNADSLRVPADCTNPVLVTSVK